MYIEILSGIGNDKVDIRIHEEFFKDKVFTVKTRALVSYFLIGKKLPFGLSRYKNL